MKLLNHPCIVLTREQHHLIDQLVQQAVNKNFGECSWLGFGKPDQKDLFYIDEIHTPEQTNTAGNSEMAEADVHRVCMEMAEKNLRLLWWGHSHARMSTFFSGTDETTWKMFTSANPEVFFATVHNFKRDKSYDRLHWNGLELSGEACLLRIPTPTLNEGELEAHMAKWCHYKAPAYNHGWYGRGKGSPATKATAAGNTTGTGKATTSKKSKKRSGKPSAKQPLKTPNGFDANQPFHSTLEHDGKSSDTAFVMSSGEKEDDNFVVHLCGQCKIPSFYTADEHWNTTHYNCTRCNRVNRLPRLTYQANANALAMISQALGVA